MKSTIRKHLKQKKDRLKKQLERNHAHASDDYIEALTEYADDSSDNIYDNEDEKREYEEHKNINSTMLNYSLSSYELPPHPLDTASCCERIWQAMTSWWVVDLIRIGRERPLRLSDLYALPKTESISASVSKWDALRSSNSYSVLRMIWEIEKGDIVFVLMLNLLRALIIVGLLYLWQFLIAFYTDPDVPFRSGVVLALYMLVLNVLRTIVNSVITNTCSSMGTRMMGMMMSVMYSFGLQMDLMSSTKQASLNIIGSNLEYIGWGLLYLPSSMMFAIILFIISFLFLYMIVGGVAWIGIAFVVLIGIPLQILVLLRVSWADDARFEISDERVSLMNDLFHGIKFIKLYSWEIPLMHRIASYRSREKVHVDSYNCNLAWLRLINFAIPSLMLVCIVCLYLYEGHQLHLFVMFQLIIVAQILQAAIEMIPVHALFATEFVIALCRMDEFLSTPRKTQMIGGVCDAADDPEIAISIKNASFGDHLLSNISLEIARGELCAIVGAVGAGKSCLMNAILGEVAMRCGTHYVCDTMISYVPQQSFILNGSVRDNILLGLPFCAHKYERVIALSALGEDLSILACGDETEIGEQGVTISGGQKMRISFARALYRSHLSDLFLFDDPLSSVDVDVGQCMFRRGIVEHLRDKTRVVVMNSHLFYLKYFDAIYVMNGGTISEPMTYHELMQEYPVQFGSNTIGNRAMTPPAPRAPPPPPHKRKKKKKKKIAAAKKKVEETGPVPWNVYRDFFWCAIRSFDFESRWFKKKNETTNNNNNNEWITISLMVLTLLMLIVSQISDPVADLILIIWSDTGGDDTAYWICLWCGAICLIAVLRFLSGLFVSRWLSRAAFDLMMRTLYFTLRAPMFYYDVTPKSAVLNRFTKDTSIIDIDIPFDCDIFSSQLLIAISYMMIVCIFIPQMIVILLLSGVAFYYLISAYRRTYIECVRACIASIDPITSIFSETLIGLSSIRCYKLSSYFCAIMTDRCTCFINLWYVRNSVYSWFDCCADLLIDAIVIAATIMGFYARDSFSSPALVAFAIVYLNIISGHLQVAMLQLVWLESEFGAVQRLLWYHPQQHNLSYEAHPAGTTQTASRSDWPTKGHLIIRNLRLKYGDDLVLNFAGQTIDIGSRQKIGICGRSGAGKSSLMVALFRLVEAEEGSSILLDGVECCKVGLYSLRTAITIIPQDPMLFAGTLRDNLDPFAEYEDEQIRNVLRKLKLNLAGKKLEKLSHGEKQLICIARALLKKTTTLLLLDEATSSCDQETDRKIQELIRKEFLNTTVLCIAHRIQTILDYDRILVLDKGRIAQFDTPKRLMTQKNGLFAQMISTRNQHQH